MIIPKWVYEKAVSEIGREAADRHMAKWDAVAVADWSEAVDLQAVKEKVNHG